MNIFDKNKRSKKHYIVNDTFVLLSENKNGDLGFKILMPKGTSMVITKITDTVVQFVHQGHGNTTLTVDEFNMIDKTETEFSENYINDYIINHNINDVKKVISELKKTFKDDRFYSKVLRTISTWIFQTKGSNAINAKTFNSLNFSELPWRNGFSSKPYSFNENRSGRTTVAPSKVEIEEWEKSNMVLPIGIKREEQCTYPEIVKIAYKILQEVCGMSDIDQRFISVVSKYITIDPNYIHLDYTTKEHISVKLFEANEHHSKTKGLELCHIDPSLEYCTFANNITVGSSESNRSQSGNTVNGLRCYGYFQSIMESNCDESIKQKAKKYRESEDWKSLRQIDLEIS